MPKSPVVGLLIQEQSVPSRTGRRPNLARDSEVIFHFNFRLRRDLEVIFCMPYATTGPKMMFKERTARPTRLHSRLAKTTHAGGYAPGGPYVGKQRWLDVDIQPRLKQLASYRRQRAIGAPIGARAVELPTWKSDFEYMKEILEILLD